MRIGSCSLSSKLLFQQTIIVPSLRGPHFDSYSAVCNTNNLKLGLETRVPLTPLAPPAFTMLGLKKFILRAHVYWSLGLSETVYPWSQLRVEMTATDGVILMGWGL